MEEAFAIATDLSDRWLTAQIVEMQGWVADESGDDVAARRYYEDSLALFRATGDHRAIGTGLVILGLAAGRQGDDRQASGYFEQALLIFRELGARMRQRMALYGLGVLAQRAGDSGRSRLLFEECLALGRGTGDHQVTVSALLGLGALARAVGDLERARTADDEARAIAMQSGRARLIAQVVSFWGMQAIAEGSPRRGTRLIAAVIAAGFQRPTPFAVFLGYNRPTDCLAIAKASLGEQAYAAAWAEGQAVTLDEAIAYALEDHGR